MEATPAACTRCGHQVEPGGRCVHCGQPAAASDRSQFGDWRTDTVIRPTSRPPTGPPPSRPPPVAPPVGKAPPEARYPLFADEVGADEVGTPQHIAPPPRRQRPRSRLPWLLAACSIVICFALIGAVLLFRDVDSEADSDAEDQQDPPTATEAPTSAPTTPSPTGPTTGPSDGAGKGKQYGKPAAVAGSAIVSAPPGSPPNQDVDGNRVTFAAPNLVDGQPTTCWRRPGDATGDQLVFTLAKSTRLTQVGLINGYAKTSGRLDWYAGNRRVTKVEWTFDDGTTVQQTLGQARTMQTVDVDRVVTKRVRLRLLAVTAPGTGPAQRDFTPISEVTLVGGERKG